MHNAPSIQQASASCNSSLRYSRIHQGGDIFELLHYSRDLAPIDTDCSIVKRHVSRISNIIYFRKYCQIRCTLNLYDLEVVHSAMPK